MSVFPYRYDHVGSFLRPSALKRARAEFFCGSISATQLRQVEDRAIAELVAKQEQYGLKDVTDGEFRRAFWHYDFIWDLIGMSKVNVENFTVDFNKDAKCPKPVSIKITGKLDFPDDHPFINDFKYLKSVTKHAVPKQTIPSPTLIYAICVARDKNYQPIDAYKDDSVLIDDLVKVYKKAIQAFYDAGCRYLQLDDTIWGELCSLDKRANYKLRGINPDELAAKYVSMLNRILEGKPQDLCVTMHICRGNFRSNWFSSGGYEPVAKELFGNLKIDGFFLEYDSDRSGDFEPLRYIKDQKVVLGLITSKTPQLENVDEVVTRVREAENYVAKEQLCLSTQCGFASTEEGNLLTEDEQWAKIKLVEAAAKKAFDL